MSLPTSAIAAESRDRSARSRKNEREILRRLASVGAANVAKVAGVHESTISRLNIPMICDVLAALDLKTVSTSLKCYNQDDIDAMFKLTRSRLNSMESVEALAEDDPE